MIQDVVRGVSDTSTKYWDKRSQRIVVRAVRAGCAHEGFVKALASAIVKIGEKGELDKAQSYVFLRWSFEVTDSLDLAQVWSKKVIARLALVQSKLLYGLSAQKNDR
jgi:hypothetical protein